MNNIGDTGITSLSEALKSNTTLIKLYLGGENKRRHQRHTSTIHFFPFLLISTDNWSGETGVTSLSEALKSNTTLTKLDLSGEDKKHQKDILHQFTSFLMQTGNDFRDTGITSLSEALKSNTTLTTLDLCGEDKRKKTQKTSINNSLYSIYHTKQQTKSKKEEQHH